MQEYIRAGQRDVRRFVSSPAGGAARESYTKHIDQGAGGMSLHNTGTEYGRCPYCKRII
jgi:hypothetical protein